MRVANLFLILVQHITLAVLISGRAGSEPKFGGKKERMPYILCALSRPFYQRHSTAPETDCLSAISSSPVPLSTSAPPGINIPHASPATTGPGSNTSMGVASPFFLSESLVAAQRPFYVIGHMVNSIWEVDNFIESGANALEVDVQFEGSGRATKMYHGVPCDCFRVCTRGTPFTEYLNYMRTVTSTDGGKFEGKMTLLVLDLKTSGINEGNQYQAGVDIARKLIRHLWRDVSPNNTLDVLVSIRNPKDGDIFSGVLAAIEEDRNSQHWLEHIGFAFDQFDDPAGIEEVFSENGIVGHRWLGSGITNCLLHTSRYNQLKDIVSCRDGRKSGCDYVDKGFTWTMDKESTMAQGIKIGLDGVMTNYPKNALAAMRRKDVAPLVRLAGPEDSPWTRVVTDS